MEDLKWKRFELSKFVGFIFDEKIDSLDKRYFQINNDFSKFINGGESYYECQNLVYFHKQKTPKNNRFIYFKSEFDDGIEYIDDDKSRERQQELKDIKCHRLKTYLTNYNKSKQKWVGNNIMTPEQVTKLELIKKSDMYFAATTLGIADKYEAICLAGPDATEPSAMNEACKEAFKKASIGLNQKEYSSKKTEAYNEGLKDAIEKLAKDYGLSQVEVLTFIKDNILPLSTTMDALRVVAEDGLKADGIEWVKKGKNAKLPETLRIFLKKFELEDANQTDDMNKLIGNLNNALEKANTDQKSGISGAFGIPEGFDFYQDKKKKKVSSAKTAVGKDLVEDIKISK